MPRYRVIVYGGMDGLEFPDLIVKYSSGYSYPLKVRRGDYVPIEIFDPLDIKKSLTVGSLGRHIQAKNVIIEYSDLEKNKKKRRTRKKKKDLNKVKPSINPSVEKPKKSQQKTEETKTVNVQKEVQKEVQNERIDLQDFKATDDFLKLSLFNKLQFIKNCKDKSLLQDLLNKLDNDERFKKLDPAQFKVQIITQLESL